VGIRVLRVGSLIAGQTCPALCHVIIEVVVTTKSERVDVTVVEESAHDNGVA
jgi:hypothetical protein